MNMSERNGRVPGVLGGAFLLACTAGMMTARAQTSPVLTLKPSGTNEFSITITNSIGMADFDLEWNTGLNADSLWTYAAIGVPGGTNFLVAATGYPVNFFRVIQDTNAVPLWQQSDPNNPNSPVLQVTITTPANGANLTQ